MTDTCPHNGLISYLGGGISAVDGEYYDDIETVFFCKDCGADLTHCRIQHGERWIDVEIVCIFDTSRQQVVVKASEDLFWKGNIKGDTTIKRYDQLKPMEATL